jgi:hypothetical protein
MERTSRAIERNPGLGSRDLREAVKGRNETIGLARRLLVADGYVEQRPNGAAFEHHSIRPYRADEDPQRPSVSHVSPCVPSVSPGHVGEERVPRVAVPTKARDVGTRSDGTTSTAEKGTVSPTAAAERDLADRAEQIAARHADLDAATEDSQ